MRVYVNLVVKEKRFSKPDYRRTACGEETMCPNDGFVYFRNSELISGQLGKVTLGSGNKVGLFSVLLRVYNAHAATACMSRLAKFSARWIGNHGFSIGIDDVQPGKLLNEQKYNTLQEAYRECEQFFQSYNIGQLSLVPGFDEAQSLVCMNELHWSNSPLIMSQCGSKGSPINISQMMICVGQQAVGGARAPDGFIERSLPHFTRKSTAPKAKGFVDNSFYSGLTATDFFFHTMGGREGLVDTAVKTAETGYVARKLVKVLEDFGVQYDMTVRDSSGTVLQFLYGDDGMDPALMEGSNGFPLDFKRLGFKVEATCPAGRNNRPSPPEITEYMKERLLEAGIASDAFKEKLDEFFCELARKKRSFSRKQLQVFLDACISRLRSKRIEEGTSVGLIGAQSIGEPGTQMTLKTFHFAGVASKNVTLGFPRVKEIFEASKKIKVPVITVKLEDGHTKETAEAIKGRIEKTTLGQVCKSITLEIRVDGGSIIVELDIEKIDKCRLCINAHIAGEKILCSLRKGKVNLNVRVHHYAKLEVIAEADYSEIHFVLDRLLKKLPMIVIQGIDNVEHASIMDEMDENKKKTGNLYLSVEGTGLGKVLGIHGVNGCKTKSNHVLEMEKTLGIEAARACIIMEIQEVFKGYEIDVDVRHLMLLADAMTSKGETLGINRFGLAKMKASILMLASYETPGQLLFNAAVNGRVDKIDGVTERVIMGKQVQLGTGMFKVRQRIDSIPAFNYTAGPDPIIS